jgi:hypothetical protein
MLGTGLTFRDLQKLFLSYPAIAFWLAVFGVSSFFISGFISYQVVRRPTSPVIPSVRTLVSHRASRTLIRIGSTISAAGIVLAIIATHRHATVKLARGQSPRSFTRRTVVTADVSGVAAALALLALGWTAHTVLSTLVFFPAILVSHLCVDLMARHYPGIGIWANAVIAAALLAALVLECAGSQLRLGRVAQLGSLFEICAFVVVHIRFMINGEIVLGARFLPTEVRPAVLGSLNAV